MLNILTIDVEEYFHLGLPGEGPSPQEVKAMPSRVSADVARILDLLDRFGARATFFVLGEVAQARPALVRTIESSGHEIASHGFRHIPVDTLSAGQFGEDLDRSLDLLGSLMRSRPFGYRAPIWSVGRAPWALDLLIARGFEYDSSFAPVPPLGPAGLVHSATLLHREGGSILELPPLTGWAGPWRYPVGFALGLRLIPSRVLARAIASENACERPAVLALHPWELDPDPPAMRLAPWLGLAHGFGVERVRPKLEAILGEFRFGAVRDVYPGAARSEGAA